HPPRGLHITQVGQAGEVVAGYGTWEDRRILIAGPAHDVVTSREALIRRGTPRHIIHTQSFDHSPFWL
ncbi:oxidoreductase, partial [Corynebacterium rouxii]|nr:oxidoreductase [Corynebacterium rouxii]